MPKPNKPILYIFVNNHFDPIWRRCWDRRFVFKGDTFISYADIESYYLLDNLALAREHPEYKFEAEFSLVMQKFLERHPDRLEELRQLRKEGRFGITGGGQVIVDTNLIQGESIVRNYLVGLLWVEDTFGQKTCLAVRNDGFGNSAQLPQILRGVEIDWATGMSYSRAEGIYWRGLDGSTIVTAGLPEAASGGGVVKYAPCPACRGTGVDSAGASCSTCLGRGIDPALHAFLPDGIDPEAFKSDGPTTGAASLKMGPEELLPNPALIDWAKAQAQDYDVRFALEEDVLPQLKPWFDALVNLPAADLHPGIELNPNNTGVYVTRIRTKQNVRRQEYAMAATELLAVMAALKGQAYPRQPFDAAWKTLLFTMFHDSVTATHVDPGYEEIQAMWAEIDQRLSDLRAQSLAGLLQAVSGTLSVVNPAGQVSTQVVSVRLPEAEAGIGLKDDQGQPVAVEIRPFGDGQVELAFVAREIPPFTSRMYYLAEKTSMHSSPSANPTLNRIENQRYRVEADDHGLLSVFDKRLNTEVLKAGEYRPGELILEHDEGSPWATLHPDQSRTPLSSYTSLTAVEKTPISQRMIFEVSAPFRAGYVSDGLKARVSLTLWEGIDRVDFNAQVDWDTFNHRLRVAMPVPVSGLSIYGIPYGILERQAYEPSFHWYAANGDWPAINWAGVETQGYSVALLNKGLPSYRIEPGQPGGQVILLSLLRSPCIPTYLHEPGYYTMTAWDGMRDAGQHTFEYALTTYLEVFADNGVAADAEGYNAGLLAFSGKLNWTDLPALVSQNCRISAVKWSEKGEAVVLRLVEFRGKGGEAVITLPDWVNGVERTNLLERQGQPIAVINRRVSLSLRPWEVTTLVLSLY